MIQLPKDFKDFLKLLNEHDVQYLLIGGYAIAFYGHPRATGDIDLWVGTSFDNAQKIVRAIKLFGFDVPTLKTDLFIEKDKVIRLGNPPFRIELLTTISGVEFEDCYSRRNLWIVENVEVTIISKSDLLINKKASGRHKDLDDLENLP